MAGFDGDTIDDSNSVFLGGWHVTADVSDDAARLRMERARLALCGDDAALGQDRRLL